MLKQLSTNPDYGVDAPNVMRNLFLFGGLALVLVLVTPGALHFGKTVVLWHRTLECTGGFLLAEGLLFLLYVKVGKFRHRDFMLEMHEWTGAEQVLDVAAGVDCCLPARPSGWAADRRPVSISGPTWTWAATLKRRHGTTSNWKAWPGVARW